MEKRKILAIFVIILVSTLIPITILSFSVKNSAETYQTYAKNDQISFLINGTLYDDNITLNMNTFDVVNLSVYWSSAESDIVNRSMSIRLKGYYLQAVYCYGGISNNVNVSTSYIIYNISLNSTNVSLGITFGSVGKHTLIIEAILTSYRSATLLENDILELFESLEEICNLTQTYFLELNSSFQTLNNSYSITVNQLLIANDSINNLTTLYNDLQLNYTILQSQFDELEENCTATSEMLAELGNLTDIINELTESIDNLSVYYDLLAENYTILLENYTDLYNNFTDYVNLLNSFGNITLLIQNINANILIEHNRISTLNSSLITLTNTVNSLSSSVSTLQTQMTANGVWHTNMSSAFNSLHANVHTLDAQVAALDLRIDELELKDSVIYPSLLVFGVGYTADYSCAIPLNYYITHANTNAIFIMNFIIKSGSSGHYKLVFVTSSTVLNIVDSGHYYVHQGVTTSVATTWGVINGDSLSFSHAHADDYLFTSSPEFTLGGDVLGRIVSAYWLKDENEGAGYMRVFAVYLVYVHAV